MTREVFILTMPWVPRPTSKHLKVKLRTETKQNYHLTLFSYLRKYRQKI